MELIRMHNCSKTKEQIIELLLDGADRPGGSLSSEMHACRECSAEFDSLNATLRIMSRLKEIATPSESYWTSYHAGLREKLLCVGQRRGGHGEPPLQMEPATHNVAGLSRLTTLLKSSIRVPVPVAAAAMIVCVVLFSLWFRKSEQPTIQSTSVVHVPVEVPVIQEKIVTRVVYKERRTQSKNPTRTNGNPNVENTFARTQPIEPNLNGFKPAENVKLTVIKGGSTNEN
jgi:hypothetical protein